MAVRPLGLYESEEDSEAVEAELRVARFRGLVKAKAHEHATMPRPSVVPTFEPPPVVESEPVAPPEVAPLAPPAPTGPTADDPEARVRRFRELVGAMDTTESRPSQGGIFPATAGSDGAAEERVRRFRELVGAVERPDTRLSRQPFTQYEPEIIPAAQQPAAAPATAGGLVFPVKGYTGKVDLHWGEHPGAVDLFAPAGTPVLAAKGGKVVSAGYTDVGGFNVTIEGDDGLSYYYAHLADEPLVRPGQTVGAGTELGGVGDTGNAKGTGAHLHFGAGKGIATGTGPGGGAGIDFDVVSALQAAQRGAAPIGPAADTGVPSDWEAAAAYVADRARAKGLGEEGARAAVAVLKTEGGWQGKPNLADANVSGGSSEGGFHLNFGKGNPGEQWARQVGMTNEEAIAHLRSNPLAATDWWLDGRLGQKIRDGMERGLSGPELATYAQRHGQISIKPETAGANYTALFGQGQPTPTAGAVSSPSQPPSGAETRSQERRTGLDERMRGRTYTPPPTVGFGPTVAPEPEPQPARRDTGDADRGIGLDPVTGAPAASRETEAQSLPDRIGQAIANALRPLIESGAGQAVGAAASTAGTAARVLTGMDDPAMRERVLRDAARIGHPELPPDEAEAIGSRVAAREQGRIEDIRQRRYDDARTIADVGLNALRAAGQTPTDADADRLTRSVQTMIDPTNVALSAILPGIGFGPNVAGALALTALASTGQFTGGKTVEMLGGDETAQTAGEIIGALGLPISVVGGINIGAARARGARAAAQARRQGAFEEQVRYADETSPFEAEAGALVTRQPRGARPRPAAIEGPRTAALTSAESQRLPAPQARAVGAREVVYGREARQAPTFAEGSVVEQATPRRPALPERATERRPVEFMGTMERESRGVAPRPAEVPAQERGLFDEAPYPAVERPALAEPRAAARPAPLPISGEARVSELVPVADVRVDPSRFQFKQLVDSGTGASAKLKDARFNERLSGMLYGWEDESGQVFVVNGHHRLDLAKRTGAPNIRMLIDRAADGVTEQQARATGALMNISEDMGTDIDVAKFLRDSGANINLLRSHGISPTGRLASRGAALAELDETLFRQVIQGTLPDDQAVIIGQGLPGNFPAQRDAAELVRANKLTPSETRALVQEATGENVRLAQDTLFGETISEKSTLIARAKLRAWVGDQLAKDRRLFGFVAQEERAQELTRGRNIIDVQESGRIASESAQASGVFDALANRQGPIADAISEGAAQLVRGDNVQRVRAATLDRVRRAVIQEQPGGQARSQVDPLGETGGARGPAGGGLETGRRATGEPPPTPERGGGQGQGAFALADLGYGAAGSALSQAETDEETPTEERLTRALLGFGAIGLARKIRNTRSPELRKFRQMGAPRPGTLPTPTELLTKIDPRDAYPHFRQIEKAALAKDPGAARAHNLAVRVAGAQLEADAILERELRPILLRTVKAGVDLDDVDTYMRAAQTIELEANGYAAPGGATTAEARKTLTDLEAEVGPTTYRAIQRVERELQDYQNRNFLERARGTFLTDEDIRNFQAKGQHYFPHEVIDYVSQNAEHIPVGKPPLSVASNAFKARKGSEREVANPLDAIVRKTYRIENAIVRNEVGTALVEDLLTIDPKLAVPRVGTDPLPATKGIISYFENGEKQSWVVDEIIAREAKQLDLGQSAWLLRAVRLANGVSRTAFTATNPDFGLRNVIRDALGSFYREGLFPFGYHHLKGMRSALLRDEDWEFYARTRSGISGLYETSRSETEKTVAELARPTSRRLVRKVTLNRENWIGPFKLIERVNEILEQGTRIGVLTAQSGRVRGPALPGRLRGLIGEPTTDVATASARAREASIDFGNAHALVKTANMVSLFLNAQIKGGFNAFEPLWRGGVWREGTDLKDPRRLRAVLRLGLTLTAAATAYHYNKLYGDLISDVPQYERDKNIILLYGSGQDERGNRVPAYIAIPKSNELAAFWNPAEAALRAIEGEDPQSFRRVGESLLSGVTPLSSFSPAEATTGALPPSLQVAHGIASDYDAFREQPIEGRLRELPRDERVRPGTSEAAQTLARSWVGEKMGLSPVQIDYIVGGFLGGTGRAATWTVDEGARLLQIYEEEAGAEPSREVTMTRTPGVRGLLRAYGGQVDENRRRLRDTLRDELVDSVRGEMPSLWRRLPDDDRIAIGRQLATVANAAVYGTETLPSTEIENLRQDLIAARVPRAEQTRILSQLRAALNQVAAPNERAARSRLTGVGAR